MYDFETKNPADPSMFAPNIARLLHLTAAS